MRHGMAWYGVTVPVIVPNQCKVGLLDVVSISAAIQGIRFSIPLSAQFQLSNFFTRVTLVCRLFVAVNVQDRSASHIPPQCPVEQKRQENYFTSLRFGPTRPSGRPFELASKIKTRAMQMATIVCHALESSLANCLLSILPSRRFHPMQHRSNPYIYSVVLKL